MTLLLSQEVQNNPVEKNKPYKVPEKSKETGCRARERKYESFLKKATWLKHEIE